MNELIIRRARFDDGEALAALAERTFRDAFAADNSASDIEAYVREAFSREAIERELTMEGSVFLLASDADGSLMGYGKLRRQMPEASVGGDKPVEIERLYVDQRAIGLGLGAALMRALLEEAASRGFETVWLGVWERNERAIRFYQQWGFEVVGTHIFRLGLDDQTDLVMARSLTGTAGPVDAESRIGGGTLRD